MELDVKSPLPLHVQLKDLLRNEILQSEFYEAGVQILKRLEAKIPEPKVDEVRMAQIKTRQKEWEDEIVSLAMVDGNPVNPRRALLKISIALPKNAVVATDIGNVSSTANSYLKFTGEGNVQEYGLVRLQAGISRLVGR